MSVSSCFPFGHWGKSLALFQVGLGRCFGGSFLVRAWFRERPGLGLVDSLL